MLHVRKFPTVFLALFALCAAAFGKVAPVVVIYGEKSLSDAAERKFAQALSNHAVKWYRDGGIAADQASDADLASSLSGRRVAHLVYCDRPDAGQLAEIRRFVRDGGKLIVTFSSSAGLAEIMGVSIGRYQKDRGGTFYSMLFEPDRPPNIPSAIQQSSPNIVSAEQIPGRSRTIAWWYDRNGEPTRFAAWIMSDAGFWMTHVLLADGDARAKGNLLVALAAALVPELWDEAARARIDTARRVGPWNDPADAIGKTAGLKDSTQVIRMRQMLRQSAKTYDSAREMLEAGRPAVAWMIAGDLEREMLESYGMLYPSRQGEIRAVWDRSGQGLFPGNWPRTCRALKDAGITDILVNVAGPGFAHCAIDAFPRSAVFDAEGDQLLACVNAAKPLGIRVHAWLVCFSTTQATSGRLEAYRQKGWLLHGTDGNARQWLDPSSKAARAQIVKAAEELLVRYDIDGIHLDFVRYPDYFGSLGDGTRIRFEADRGKAVGQWPGAVRNGALFAELVRWRTAQVTALVADIRTMQRRMAPGKEVSVAVLGKYPTCVESVGQDWMSWLECGYVDYVYPMNYTESERRYGELLKTQLGKKSVAMRTVGGIGVTAAESRLDADGVIAQISALRKGGAAGFALFDLDSHLMNDVLPVLKLGVTSPAGAR